MSKIKYALFKMASYTFHTCIFFAFTAGGVKAKIRHQVAVSKFTFWAQITGETSEEL